MRDDKDRKSEVLMTPGQAAAYLRRLADELDKGQVEFGSVSVEEDGSVKVKQSVKTKPDKASFKLKLKYEKRFEPESQAESGAEPAPETEPAVQPAPAPRPEPEEEKLDAQGRPSYKKVKKRMQSRLGGIKKSVNWGGLPQVATAKAFHADCLLMCTYEGKGDEYYAAFRASADRFLAAVTAGDAEGAAQALEEMNAQKKDCHKRYK